jgi:hypothetical protein
MVCVCVLAAEGSGRAAGGDGRSINTGGASGSWGSGQHECEQTGYMGTNEVLMFMPFAPATAAP